MRVARQAVCCALLGAFVIGNPQCGAYRAGHAQLAHAYLRDGLYDQALAETRRAIRQDGPDDRLLLIAALARLGLDEVDAALELIGQAVALAPDNDDLYRALRDICQKEERFAQTEELLAQLHTGPRAECVAVGDRGLAPRLSGATRRRRRSTASGHPTRRAPPLRPH